MSEIEVFQFPTTGQQMRTVIRDGQPWFVALDAAAMLDLGNPRSSVALLDDDERDVHTMDTPGGRQNVVIVSESGLYSLILRSRKPEARAFKRWITHDVLPQIRMTGRYEAPHSLPQTYAAALRELASTVERAEYAERELEAAAPKAQAWEVLASSEGDYSVREAAYILNRDPGIDVGQNRLFAVLREWKMLDRTNRPYANHSKHLTLRATHYEHPRTGEEMAATQVRVTFAGLNYLHQRMGGTTQLRLLLPASPEAA